MFCLENKAFLDLIDTTSVNCDLVNTPLGRAVLCQMKACSQVIAHIDWAALKCHRPALRAPESEECEKQCLAASILTHPNLTKWATANKNCFRLSALTCMNKYIFFYFVYHLIFLTFCVYFQTHSGTALTQSLFYSTSEAFPPSSLPGIPESILAIENVKNEEKAKEGATSTAAGRVLSHCTHIQSPVVEVARNGWNLT